MLGTAAGWAKPRVATSVDRPYIGAVTLARRGRLIRVVIAALVVDGVPTAAEARTMVSSPKYNTRGRGNEL